MRTLGRDEQRTGAPLLAVRAADPGPGDGDPDLPGTGVGCVRDVVHAHVATAVPADGPHDRRSPVGRLVPRRPSPRSTVSSTDAGPKNPRSTGWYGCFAISSGTSRTPSPG